MWGKLILLFVLITVGLVWGLPKAYEIFKCARLTICFVASEFEVQGKRYVLNQVKVDEMVKKYAPNQKLESVFLWKEADAVGGYAQVSEKNRRSVFEVQKMNGGKVIDGKFIDPNDQKSFVQSIGTTSLSKEDGLNYFYLFVSPAAEERLVFEDLSKAVSHVLYWTITGMAPIANIDTDGLLLSL